MVKKESFFWTSYSDLMTSMFFIMLVLFILSLVIVRNKNAELRNSVIALEHQKDSLITTVEDQKRLLKIDEQFEPLKNSGKFKYYEKSRKFVAKDLLGKEIFQPNSAVILDEYKEKTIDIGKTIEKFIRTLENKNSDFRYLLVIEGNVANSYDKKYPIDGEFGYKLSYERALAVYNLWNNNGINLRKSNVEVLICGSGWNGIDRDTQEDYNKRFSVQIIPKVSSPKSK